MPPLYNLQAELKSLMSTPYTEMLTLVCVCVCVCVCVHACVCACVCVCLCVCLVDLLREQFL